MVRTLSKNLCVKLQEGISIESRRGNLEMIRVKAELDPSPKELKPAKFER